MMSPIAHCLTRIAHRIDADCATWAKHCAMLHEDCAPCTANDTGRSGWESFQ